MYPITKRLRTLEEVEKYFPAGFLAFMDCSEQHRYQQDLLTRIEEKDVLLRQKEKTYCKESDYG
jgi:hypothetical protein